MPGPVFLRGDDVTLRPPEREDVPFIARCMNDSRVWRPALDVNPTNEAQATEFFETVLSNESDVHVLACEGGDPLGILSLSTSQYGPDETSRARSAELAYWFAPDHHGAGYAGDAARELVRYAFEDRNLRRLEADIGAFNDASVGLVESLGFEREGVRREAMWYDGDYRDAYVYGLLRSDWR
ncbi:GNAT family N-acetyltransferase [Halocalculus aciditolerans]|uniref:N-acetyltransferase n=1 Tax=Halocalculus aciditolerans TaxID=1383812 RepID=A0A830F022_9EURY|nr:GNAT family protein [Halocalculus aciditolerans]GGL49405.1 N-acetyltransferase [Halocalculus aciditolerans]